MSKVTLMNILDRISARSRITKSDKNRDVESVKNSTKTFKNMQFLQFLTILVQNQSKMTFLGEKRGQKWQNSKNTLFFKYL